MLPEPVMVHVSEPMPVHVVEPIEVPVRLSPPVEEPIVVRPMTPVILPMVHTHGDIEPARGQEVDPFAIALMLVITAAVVIGFFWGRDTLRKQRGDDE